MKNNLQSKCHLSIEQRLKLLYWRVNLTRCFTGLTPPRLNVWEFGVEIEKIGLLVSLCALSEPDLVPRVNTACFSLLFKL